VVLAVAVVVFTMPETWLWISALSPTMFAIRAAKDMFTTMVVVVAMAEESIALEA
jgi:hypothetical protein